MFYDAVKLLNMKTDAQWQDMGVTGGTGNTIARKWAEQPEEEYSMYITLFTYHSLYI